MAIDYRGYSVAELLEALASIDASKHPDNFEALNAEIARRKESGEYEEEVAASLKAAEQEHVSQVLFAVRARSWIAYYLILTAPLVAINQSYSGVPSFNGASYLYLGVGILYCSVLVFVCISMLRNKAWATNATIALLTLQIPKIQSSPLYFDIGGPLTFQINLQAGGAIGFDVGWVPEFAIHLSPNINFLIGIDLFAVMMIVMLFLSQFEMDLPDES